MKNNEHIQKYQQVLVSNNQNHLYKFSHRAYHCYLHVYLEELWCSVVTFLVKEDKFGLVGGKPVLPISNLLIYILIDFY